MTQTTVIAHLLNHVGRGLGFWGGGASFSVEAGSEGGIGDGDGEVLGVEVFAEPFEALGAVRVGGVGKNLVQFCIAPNAAAIFRRTVALAGDAGGIGLAVDGGLDFLDGRRVVPIVAEIVDIAEAGDAGFEHAAQGQAVLVGDVIDGAAVAILSAVDVEGMEVAALPTHRCLDRLMQRAERHRAGHEEPAPDRRLRSPQRHLQADYALIVTSPWLDGLGHDPRTCRSDASPSPFLRDGAPDGKWAYRATGSGCSSRVRRMD